MGLFDMLKSPRDFKYKNTKDKIAAGRALADYWNSKGKTPLGDLGSSFFSPDENGVLQWLNIGYDGRVYLDESRLHEPPTVKPIAKKPGKWVQMRRKSDPNMRYFLKDGPKNKKKSSDRPNEGTYYNEWLQHFNSPGGYQNQQNLPPNPVAPVAQDNRLPVNQPLPGVPSRYPPLSRPPPGFQQNMPSSQPRAQNAPVPQNDLRSAFPQNVPHSSQNLNPLAQAQSLKPPIVQQNIPRSLPKPNEPTSNPPPRQGQPLRQSQQQQPQIHAQGVSSPIKEASQVSESSNDPLITKLPLGAKGQRVYVPGQSQLNLKAFGSVDSPTANYKHLRALDDLRRLQDKAQGVTSSTTGTTQASSLSDPLLTAELPLGAKGQRIHVPGQSKLNMNEFGETHDPEANYRYLKALDDLKIAQGQPKAPAQPQAQQAQPNLPAPLPAFHSQASKQTVDPLVTDVLPLGAKGQRMYVASQSKLDVPGYGKTNSPSANYQHMAALEQLRKLQERTQGRSSKALPTSQSQASKTTMDPLVTNVLPLGAKGQRIYVPGQSKLDVPGFGSTSDPSANYRHLNAIEELKRGQEKAKASGQLQALERGIVPTAQSSVIDPLETAKLPLGAKGQRVHVPGQSQLDPNAYGTMENPSANYRYLNDLDRLRKGT